jgi:hypothetical protein
MTRWLLAALVAAIVTCATARMVQACPGCEKQGATFCEEFAVMDAAVIARLVKVHAAAGADDEIPKATFQVTGVLKGAKLVKVGDKFESLYFGDGKLGKSFLVMGVGAAKLAWSTPLPVSDRAVTYLKAIVKLPADQGQRLIFFQKHLEDEDPLLARDAYDEFARAPYAQIKALKPHLDHDRIVAWIKNAKVNPSHRRLYLVMLGVCGDERDVPLLEGLLRSSDRKDHAAIDMVISSYLLLRGEAGLPLVEELFLADKNADYTDTYGAIMALRFHANDFDTVEKKQLIKSLHALLDRPDLADLVIPDLAKWEDWDAIDQLFALYKNADPKQSWVRVPVVNYLRSCPLPKAKELLKECERIDPAAVERSKTFFPAVPSVEGTAG